MTWLNDDCGDYDLPMKTITNTRYHENGETVWEMTRMVECDGHLCGMATSISLPDAMRADDPKKCAQILREARAVIDWHMRLEYPNAESFAHKQKPVYH